MCGPIAVCYIRKRPEQTCQRCKVQCILLYCSALNRESLLGIRRHVIRVVVRPKVRSTPLMLRCCVAATCLHAMTVQYNAAFYMFSRVEHCQPWPGAMAFREHWQCQCSEPMFEAVPYRYPVTRSAVLCSAGTNAQCQVGLPILSMTEADGIAVVGVPGHHVALAAVRRCSSVCPHTSVCRMTFRTGRCS